MLWLNSILGLNFIFFFVLKSLSYITIPKTYLGSMANCLSKKAEMPTSDVDYGDSLCFTPPPTTDCQQPHYPPPPHPALKLTQLP